jgi:hypothetical protein
LQAFSDGVPDHVRIQMHGSFYYDLVRVHDFTNKVLHAIRYQNYTQITGATTETYGSDDDETESSVDDLGVDY